jgi:hypothetical protein
MRTIKTYFKRAPFYNAFAAAVKEALWHADGGSVRV